MKKVSSKSTASISKRQDQPTQNRASRGSLFIGTSGWSYPHWKGSFYPSALKAREHFPYYAAVFNTVEINNSFYRSPSPETYIQWGKAVPPGFMYSIKANRYFTHLKKLDVTRQELLEFLEPAQLLGTKLGPVLFQLPPRWSLNLSRLEQFISNLPPSLRYTIEFRDSSWYDSRVYALLTRSNIAFCIYELNRHQSPLIVSADFVYIRLHGPGAKYQGSYTLQQLEVWRDNITAWLTAGKDVYIYFDNDEKGYAPSNAQTLSGLFTPPTAQQLNIL